MEERRRLGSIDMEVSLGGVLAEAMNEVDLVRDIRREASTPRLGSALHRNQSRPRYLRGLAMRQKIRQIFTNRFAESDNKTIAGKSSDEVAHLMRDSVARDIVVEEDEEEALSLDDEDVVKMVDEIHTGREVEVVSQKLRELRAIEHQYRMAESDFHMRPYPLEVRLESATYDYIQKEKDPAKISTVYNTSLLYTVVKYFRRITQGQPFPSKVKRRNHVLENINLVIQPGKQYLVLGPPGSGKSTLLKMISGHLELGKKHKLTGNITYNGRSLMDQMKGLYIENAFGYVDQLDKHAALLTVGETLDFAFQCQAGGKLIREREGLSPDQIKIADQADRDKAALKIALCILGLQEVENTFVGDTNIRGVSGGQRRRVTVGEMIMSRVPVLCGDEISTGLDAASTYDMIETLLHIGRLQNFSRVFSLLQPSPEVVSLFDEVIVMADGNIIYAGPIEMVEDYFADLGFTSPQFLDVADFLQLVSTPDRDDLFLGQSELDKAPTSDQLAEKFRESELGKDIQARLEAPLLYQMDHKGFIHEPEGSFHLAALQQKFANQFHRSVYLITKRFLTLWFRDKKVLTFSVVRNLINGISVGGAFLNASDFISIQGALFQTGVFILLGSLQGIAGLLEERTFFYKHSAANFYSAWPYVFGRAVSQMPQTLLLDTIVSGSVLYWMIGLGGRSSFLNYFVFLVILFVFATLMNQLMGMYASFSSESRLQVFSAVTLFVGILFSGFIVPVATIPEFYLWLYWLNPFAWTYNALVVNEAYSGRWEDPELLLAANGFVKPDGTVFDDMWIGLGLFYMISFWLLTVVGTALGLTHWRAPTSTGTVPRKPTTPAIDSSGSVDAGYRIEMPFKPLTLAFEDLSYEVTASTTKESLKLLKGVSGIFRPGRLCALMGTSGAGKTTLLDVIALRKRSGTVTGNVYMNGWARDPVSFRRCSGYVEQFDVQAPELTVRETVIFSARLRLDPEIVRSDEEILAFVDQVLEDMELTDLRNRLVGRDDGRGLSFEQKKRLSIAVELATSPSILFLDEPTSGLDARSALLVVRLLRKVTDSGRTCVATIHQPSSSVFGMFDDLLLMKKGGQVVYHGPLGENSSELIHYFESLGATPIELGDNPANWILRVMQDPLMGDLADVYARSSQKEALKAELDIILEEPDPQRRIEFEKPYACGRTRRQFLVTARLRTIYWRSTTYNLGRIMISLAMACLLGAVFVGGRRNLVYTESDVRARIAVIFFSNIIVGIMSIVSVLPVMTWIRDMFYRHNDAGMYDSLSLGFALGTAEQWFIAISASLFCVVFLSAGGFTWGAIKVMAFFGFFTFNSALFSYFGQFFVSIVQNQKAAMILAGVYIGFNNLFAGLIIQPQTMAGTPYALTYYITPGHYILEGEITAMMANDAREVIAQVGGEFFAYLVDKGRCDYGQSDTCVAYQKDYVDFFFGGHFQEENIARNAIILGTLLVAVRLFTWLALRVIRFD
eukprot:Nitzschia sp. Nitz4//scaffold239_size30010//18370//23136//NITZ4_008013-RA/size30010-snap-gene-0.33-mRNA-1//1//CDS//3329543571//8865//frame0